MPIIRTSYQTNRHGAGQVLAKGLGRQRTVAWDPSKSSDWNHGAAAAVLLRAVLGWVDASEVSGLMAHMEHDSNDAGTKHGFKF